MESRSPMDWMFERDDGYEELERIQREHKAEMEKFGRKQRLLSALITSIFWLLQYWIWHD